MKPFQLPLGPLVPGVYQQIYMNAGMGVKEHDLIKIVKTIADLKQPGAILHFGPRTGVKNFPVFSRIVAEAGLLCGASVGLDGHEDDAEHRHDVLTAEEKGECMAEIANHPRCSFFGQDAEPEYDSGKPSKDGAIDIDKMQSRFRELAPEVFVFHQPWWKPGVHRRFPYLKFALKADCVAPQFYLNNAETVRALGKNRYRVTSSVYEREWTQLEDSFVHACGADDPRFETYQGYGWDDIPHYYVRQTLMSPVSINWTEPKLSRVVQACIRAINLLKSEGFYDPFRGIETANTAVLEWQRRYNKGRPVRIDEDGWCGHITLHAMGLL